MTVLKKTREGNPEKRKGYWITGFRCFSRSSMENYVNKQRLGEGQFATVYEAVRLFTLAPRPRVCAPVASNARQGLFKVSYLSPRLLSATQLTLRVLVVLHPAPTRFTRFACALLRCPSLRQLQKSTGTRCAIKKVRMGSQRDEQQAGIHFTNLREIKYLQELRHANVIRLME